MEAKGAPRELPTLRSERLVLRPLRETDAERIRELAGEVQVAEMTARIPHPYSLEEAVSFIQRCVHDYPQDGKEAVFAITGDGNELMGCCGLSINGEQRRAEVGYWIGRPYWGQGYMTEAARELFGWGFRDLGLRKIVGYHFGGNEASGRVLRKLGMQQEGHFRKHFQRDGRLHDIVAYGLLAEEWAAPTGAA